MFECKICKSPFKSSRALSAHIFQKHPEFNKDLKSYYDKYVDSSAHLCIYCQNPCRFLSISRGYSDTCGSKECGKKHEFDTRMEIYGQFQSEESIRAGLIKQKETMIKKYGVRHNWCNGELRERGYSTCENLYGDRNYNNPEKMKETKRNWSEKQKEENSKHISEGLQNIPEDKKKEIHARIQEKRMKSVEIWSKKISISQQNRSEEECKEIFSKRRKRIEYDGNSFDSKDEVEIYEFCKLNGIPCKVAPIAISYSDKYGKMHKYVPDFEINGRLYEVKGNHLWRNNKLYFPYRNKLSKEKLEEMDARDEAKTRCMIENGVTLILTKDLKSKGILECLNAKKLSESV